MMVGFSDDGSPCLAVAHTVSVALHKLPPAMPPSSLAPNEQTKGRLGWFLTFRLSLLFGLIVLFAWFGSNVSAATISVGNVTTALGPTFYIDEAITGGADVSIVQPAVPSYLRAFAGLLTRNQGPTKVTLTGFGFAANPDSASNTATTIAVTFTYLGADEAVGGGDDVVIGTTTGTYNFPTLTTGSEFVFKFDAPLVANLTITGTMFRIQVAPSNATNNGSLKWKSLITGGDPKMSVAGFITPLIDPQRFNLAKFQNASSSSPATPAFGLVCQRWRCRKRQSLAGQQLDLSMGRSGLSISRGYRQRPSLYRGGRY